MSERPKRTLLASPPRHNRESHINLGLIGHNPKPQPQEHSRSGDDSLEPIEESTAAQDSSAQLRSFYPKEGNANIGERYIVVGSVSPAEEKQGSGRIKHDSPWNTYKWGYDLKLNQLVPVAVRRAPQCGKVVIREFASRDADRKLDMLRRVRHEKFVEVLEVFKFENTYHVVFEHIFVTLREVVLSAPYPTERQLAAMLGQILEGLSYLSSIGLQHGSLTSSNVLLKPDGEIKLTSQECCRPADRSYPSDVRAVGYIAMELMQKYENDNGAIGVENLNRWSADSEAVKFLSMTTSAESVDELKKHALFDHPWRKEDLELLVELASFVRRAYK